MASPSSHDTSLPSAALALADTFVPASIVQEGDDAVRRGRLVVLFSWALVIWGPPNILIFYLLDAPRSALAVAIPTVCVGAVPWLLRRSGSLQLAVSAKLGSLLICLFLVELYGRGMTSAAAPWHVVIPMFAMLMLGLRGGLTWAGLSLATLALAYVVVNKLGLGPAPEYGADLVHPVLLTHLIMVLILVTTLSAIFDAVRAQAVNSLEAARMDVVEAHRSARLVLDAMQEGLLIVDLQGHITDEYSAAVTRFFGAPQPGQLLWNLIETRDADGAAYMELGFDELSAGVLPFDLCLDQLPRRLHSEGRTLAVHYTPVTTAEIFGADNQPQQILLAMNDITPQLAAEAARQKQGDAVALTGMYLRDRRGLVQFIQDSVDQVETLRAEPLDQLRALHTIKGNAAICGLHYLASTCHAIEDELQASGANQLTEAQVGEVEDAFRSAAAEFLSLANSEDAQSLLVTPDQYETLLAGLSTGMDYESLRAMVLAWREAPIRPQLERLAAQAERLAEALHGAQLTVHIDDGDVHVSPNFGRGLWSALVHLVRNAIDHGIEPPEQRTQAGKPAHGTLAFSVQRNGECVELHISDDGRGIDWARLQARAEALGLDLSGLEKSDLLFVDGLSSREEVSEVSGRGVGMAAVREAVLALGGKLEVTSQPGAGTQFTFRLPSSSAPPTGSSAAPGKPERSSSACA